MPILFFSDATHLTNFSGDKKAYPLYMTIGNLNSKCRGSPKQNAIQLIALLPVPPKMKTMAAGQKRKQQHQNKLVFHEVIAYILRNFKTSKEGTLAQCADGKGRLIFPRLCSWVADYPEHIAIANLAYMRCFWCECPKSEFGKHSKEIFPRRDHVEYRALLDSEDTDALNIRGVGISFNPLWDTGVSVSQLPQPDILHTLLLGIFVHLMQWIHSLLRKHSRLDRFNASWLTVPSYLDMTGPKKQYEEISQWSGKEMKNMCRFLLPVFCAALNNPTPSERSEFGEAITCTRRILEFYLYSQYYTHSAETLNGMELSLEEFHKKKTYF